MRNIKALTEVLEVLTAPAGKHNQSVWASLEPMESFEDTEAHYEGLPVVECATAGCVAGWASMKAGDFVSTYDLHFVREGTSKGKYMVNHIHPAEAPDTIMYMFGRGQQLLGLSYDMAEALFQSENQRPQLIEAIEMLIDGDDDDDIIFYLQEHNPNI